MRPVLSLLCTALTAVRVVEGAFAVTTETIERSTAAATNTSRLIPILVGGSALTFTPNFVVAQPGDVLQFQFGARNHTVTQSEQQSPCRPLANGGLHSGFIAFDGGASGDVGTFIVPVANTQPMYLYCAQGAHCQGGMVMTVNAPASSDLISYASLAASQMQNLPAPQVAGGVAATIPLANAIVPKASNTTAGTNPPAGSNPGPMNGTAPPRATATATVMGQPRGGTATVFTTVVVGPSGVGTGNDNGTGAGMPAQGPGNGAGAGSADGGLTNAGTSSGAPSTGGGYRLGDGADLVSTLVRVVAVALGTLLLTVEL